MQGSDRASPAASTASTARRGAGQLSGLEPEPERPPDLRRLAGRATDRSCPTSGVVLARVRDQARERRPTPGLVVTARVVARLPRAGAVGAHQPGPWLVAPPAPVRAARVTRRRVDEVAED